MERRRSLVLTLAAVTAVVSLEHVYLWVRLVREPSWPPALGATLTALFALLALAIPVAVVASRFVPPRQAAPWLQLAYSWLGASVLLSLALLLLPSVVVPARASAAIAVVSAALLSTSALREGARVRVHRVEIPIPALPAGLDGFSLAQISDLHLGPTNGRELTERVVTMVNQLQPDAVVITGDLVDAPVPQLEGDVAPLAALRATHGVFFVTGNHEYHAGPTAWCAHLETLGIRVLRNELVPLSHGAAVLQLAGTDDGDRAGLAEGFREDLPAALERRDPRWPVVLLAHQPRSVHEASRRGVDLQLSGHTHGGQLWPFQWLLRLGQPLVAGLRRFGPTALFVSRGTGHSGPPMRLGVPAEVTHLILRAC